MCIRTQKSNFLDMQNYLDPGTSVRQFYESQQVSTPKGYFPYQVFDSLASFGWTSLPKRSEELNNLMNQINGMIHLLYFVINCNIKLTN